MKRYIYLIFLLGLFACQEDELVEYSQEQDALQFWADPDETNFLNWEMNFATVTYEEVVNGVPQICYYGDSLASYTFDKVVLELQGFPTPDERQYKLKTVLVEGQDSSRVAEVIFEPYYSLAPNQLKDTVKITVLRPKTRGVYTVGIVVDTDGDDVFFEKGVEECAVLRLDIKDVYEKPEDWDQREEWLGEFSEEKYAFMVTYSRKPFSRNENSMWNLTDQYNVELRRALAAFNELHPGDEKDFTFPVTTKPVWWDLQKKFLGDFSEAKHSFVKSVLKGETLAQNAKLEYWNLIFRDEVEKQGITEFSFPRNEEQSSWWRTPVLGEFSVEKQEFVVRSLFPKSYYQITDATWMYGNVILRADLVAYNEEHPGNPLNISFPVEECPEWWSVRAYYLGEYSPEKRDIAVKAVFDMQQEDGSFNIDPLTNANYPFNWALEAIQRAIDEYNAKYPGEKPIELPKVAPVWWGNQEMYLGEYSEEKEAFMRQVVSAFSGYYNEWIAWRDWNPLFRYELAAYNDEHKDQPYEFEFPVVDTRPSYWDELPYMGEYSEAKKVFVWMTLLPLNWGNVDGWYLGAPSEYGSSNDWQPRYNTLTGAYAKGYDDFMKKYAAANPTPFSFPDSW